MSRSGRLTAGLAALLLIALTQSAPAAAGSRSADSATRADDRSRIERSHHKGRSFGAQRSRQRNPSYLKREARRRALSERRNGSD